MSQSPTATGNINQLAGVYRSTCHSEERTILEGQPFPRCGYCNSDTVWILVRPVTSGKK